MPLWGANNQLANNKPTFANTANSRWYGNCYGVRADQMDQGSNPVPANPGWIGVKSWTDPVSGKTRYRLETLVAMASIAGDDPAADDFFPSSVSV
jgi:hypothetical protein